MFRPASRALLRAPPIARGGPTTRRFISTTPTGTKSRSWKNTFARVGLAAGAIYYYNTSSIFAETPTLSLRSQPKSKPEDEKPLPTLDSVKPKTREAKAPSSSPSAPAAEAASTPESNAEQSEQSLKAAEELEEEAGQQAAFNPETGEINWDCPCLGGMAYGPCGEDFRAAFSCFIYSEEDPKGIDCIEKFKAMQDCFRQHPDIYGAELEDDDEEPSAGTGAEQPLATQAEASTTSPDENAKQALEPAKSTGEVAETEQVIPQAWHESETEKQPEQQTEK
ncbi:hypothetical protein BJX76DRAFT_357375 [Aspergillus varians]